MVKTMIFVPLILMTQLVLAKEAIRLQCSFPKGDMKIEFPKFETGCKIGEPCFLQAKIFEKEKEQEVETSPVGFSRSSGVAGDEGDDRPAGLINFDLDGKSHRLAIYYCAGDGQTVVAKFFTGQKSQQKNLDFLSEEIRSGTCTGADLTRVMTNDCSSFK